MTVPNLKFLYETMFMNIVITPAMIFIVLFYGSQYFYLFITFFLFDSTACRWNPFTNGSHTHGISGVSLLSLYIVVGKGEHSHYYLSCIFYYYAMQGAFVLLIYEVIAYIIREMGGYMWRGHTYDIQAFFGFCRKSRARRRRKHLWT